MKTHFILVAMLIAGGAIGLSIPMEGEGGSILAVSDEAKGAASAQIGHTQPASPAQHSSAQWGQEIALPRAADGHFYADVMVDGYPARMLVDTGASVIALTGQDARALGLFWDDSDLSAIAQGASGPVMGVATQLPRVSLGTLEANNVSAIIVPDGLHISLLGQSFLSTVDKVEIADGRMVLGN